MFLDCKELSRCCSTVCVVPQSGRASPLEMFVALAGQDGLWCGDGAERAALAPVPGWPWPRGWSGARGAAASWQGVREPQAALICTQGGGWAGTGGGSQFPESFLLLSCSSARQAARPRVFCGLLAGMEEGDPWCLAVSECSFLV